MASSPGDAALRRYYYPPAQHTFEEVGDGTVRVTDAQGRTGLFHWDGEWISGEITQAHQQMLLWCGGPALPADMNFRWIEAPPEMGTPGHPWPRPEKSAKSHR
jgi:hypothetical protein